MKRNFLIAVMWLALPLLAVAQDSTKIIAMENLWNRAELNNDAPAVQLLLADDFVMTFQFRQDADRFEQKVRERFTDFGMGDPKQACLGNGGHR